MAMALKNSYWHTLKPGFEEIKEYISYDPVTGDFYWIKPSSKKVRVGTVIRNYDNRGYLCIKFGGKRYKAHSVAWWWVNGEMPRIIDHINGRPDDNRILNLRLATVSQNQMNRRPKVNGTSPYKGVTRITGTNRWMAHIRFQGKSFNLGHYDLQEDAARAYDKRAAQMFGSFARPNFPQEIYQ